jgi:tape measure domain-containing protein
MAADVIVKIGADNAEFKRAMGESERIVKDSASNMERSFRAIGAVITASLGVGVVRGLIDIADTYTLIEGKLKLVTNSSAQLASVQEDLYASANRVRASYESHADLYARIARSMQSYNLTQTQTIAFTEAVTRSMIVSGQTQQEAASFTIQFGQALASNRLQGEEFRAMLESNSRAVKVLTDYLQVDIGTLREWAKDGKLSADVIYNAFSAAAEKLKSEADSMPKTVGQALTQLENAYKRVIDETNETTGATTGLVGVIEDLANAIDNNRDSIIEMFAGVVTEATQAGEAVGKLIPPIQGILTLAKEFAGFGALEWGVVGFALLRGGPQAAALAAALATINNGLSAYRLNLGSLTETYGELLAAINKIGEDWNTKDWSTGAPIDQTAQRMAEINAEITALEMQLRDSGDEWISYGDQMIMAADDAETVKGKISVLRKEAAELSGAFDGIGFDSFNTADAVLGEVEVSANDVTLAMGKVAPAAKNAGETAAEAAKKASKEWKEFVQAVDTAANASRGNSSNLYYLEDYNGLLKEGAKVEKENIKQAQKNADARVDIQRDLNERTKRLTLSEREYKKWALEQELQDLKTTYAAYPEIMDQIYEYEIAAREDANTQVLQLQEELVNDMGRIMESFVSDVLKGEIESIGELFERLFESILDMWIRLIAQIAANSIIEAFGFSSGGLTIQGLFGGGGGGGAGTVASLGSAAYTAYTGESMLATAGSYLGIGGGTAAAGSAAVGEAGFGMYSSGSVYASQAGAAAGAQAGAAAGSAYAAQIASTSYTAGAGATSYATFQTAATGTGSAATGGGSGAAAGGGMSLAYAAPVALMAFTLYKGLFDRQHYPTTPERARNFMTAEYQSRDGGTGFSRGDLYGAGAATAWSTESGAYGSYEEYLERMQTAVDGTMISMADVADVQLERMRETVGDAWVNMAHSIDATLPSIDAFIDGQAGYDVSMEQSSFHDGVGTASLGRVKRSLWRVGDGADGNRHEC